MDPARLPVEVRASTRCLIWRSELRAGRPTKVPYQARRPAVCASVTDPSTWAPFAEALAVAARGGVDGVGIVLGAGLCGVDLDHVCDAHTGLIADEAMTIVAALDSYTELSPSGEGLHVLVYGTLPAGGRRTRLAIDGFAEAGVEMYGERRFFTVTAHPFSGTRGVIAERQGALVALYRRLFRPRATPHQARPPRAVDGSDAALLRRAFAARNGVRFARLWHGDASAYASHSEADLALCNMLAYWTGGDATRVDALFRQSGLYRPKWNDRRGDWTYGAQTIATALGRARAGRG